MIKKSHFKLLAIVMACLLCHSGTYAQEYDDTWTIDGVEYAWSSGEAAVIGCYSQHLVAPPEVNLYRDDGGEYVDRIVPVGNVARNAFEESSLITVDLGPNVTDLNYHCFYNCNSMTDIVCRSTIPPYVNYAFSSSMYSRVKVHVPASAYNTYKAHAEWKKFTNIVVIDSEWGVDINSTNFPDANFRSYLLTQYPKGYLTRQDIQSCTELNLYNKGISNAKGIEYFTELTRLQLYHNNLTSIDVSHNTKLTYLNLGENKLTSIDVSSNTALQELYLQNNKLTTISVNYHNALRTLWVSDNTLLTGLYCWRNALTNFDVSGCTALQQLKCYNNSNLSKISGLADCTALTYLDCEDCAITDLSAVSGMTKLATLLVSNNKITTLDVSSKSSLTWLYCYNNSRLTTLSCQNCSLTTFDCHGCTALTTLKCWNNKFTTFNVTGNTALTYLDCGPCSTLTSITGLASCTAMESLICYTNAITDLSAVSGMTDLKLLNCTSTQITSLSLEDKSQLTTLRCYDNTKLRTVEVYNSPLLTTFQCYNCPELQLVGSWNTNLSSLDLTGNTALTSVSCSNNPNLSTITNLSICTELIQLNIDKCNFSTLNVSNFANLKELRCSYNKLTSLNVSGKTQLTSCYCAYNQLTSLNVQNCSALVVVDCKHNQLTTLNVQGCGKLRSIDCMCNSITESGMTTLVLTMPTLPSSNPGNFYVVSRFDENNVLTADHITVARYKNWIPKKWTGIEYVELFASLPGDANDNGIVNITDVTVMINAIMVDNFSGINMTNADMNGDGVVNITDVTLLINHLMSL